VESVRGIHVAVSRSLPCPVRDGRAADLSQSSVAATAGAPLSLCWGRAATSSSYNNYYFQFTLYWAMLFYLDYPNAPRELNSIVEKAHLVSWPSVVTGD